MSPNERRRSPKIVEPKETKQEQGLSEGLQNAISRGENITKAKQSFINAGYKSEEIETASKKISTASKVIQQTPKPTSAPPTKQKSKQPQPTTTTQIPNPKKKLSKKFLIIMISIAVLVLVGAALLGLFWNKIF